MPNVCSFGVEMISKTILFFSWESYICSFCFSECSW